ncbi:MAG: DUF6519 domain-containing protein [Cyanobacteria bacterium P01_H01_bin.152]
MQGEFRGDFTRDTHNPSKQFLRVFMQQGRVQLDADWNEQSAILLHYLQSLATDLIGPYGGPAENCGFEMISRSSLEEADAESELLKRFDELEASDTPNFLMSPGHYYVQGKLCHNPDYVFYTQQEQYPLKEKEKLAEGQLYLAYLDVWERHITYLEDESELSPGIKEVALGKADTTTRSQLVWQVKTISIKEDDISGGDESDEDRGDSNARQAFVNELKTDPSQLQKLLIAANGFKPGTGKLKAQASIPAGPDASTPCIIAPDSRYRGAENQLYRVEIHNSGETGTATFKWSRENGSVIFPIDQIGDNTITLGHLGWDDRSSLKPGDWVELVDDIYELQGLAKSLRQVDSVDTSTLTVKLKETSSPSGSIGLNEKAHALLRRWDQKGKENHPLQNGVLPVKEGDWIELEDGIRVYFAPTDQENLPNFYTTGDYWLIAARTAIGDVEWPQESKDGKLEPMALPPHGIAHYYAPLWLLTVEDSGVISVESDGDCRCKFPNLCQIYELQSQG